MKKLSGELEQLRDRLHELEAGVEQHLEVLLEQAAEKLHARLRRRTGGALIESASGESVDVNARRRLIAELAWLKAEQRGFSQGSPEQDWLDAESEVDRLLLEGWAKTTASTHEAGHIRDS